MTFGRGRPPRPARGAVFLLVLLVSCAAATSALPAQEAPEPPREEPATAQLESPSLEEEPPPPQQEPAAGPPLSITQRVWVALKREAKRYANDSVALVKAPVSWNKAEWKRAAGVGLILGGLMLVDKDIDREVQKQRSPFTNRVSSLTTALGDQYGFEVSGAMLAAGLIFKHENLRETGRDAIEAGLIAHVLDKYFIKRAFGRERPEDSNGRNVFVPGSNHDSFPSGHATEAFAVASVVAARSKSWPISVIAYTAATIVALDRLNVRAHFASDVVGGAILGSAVGHFLVNRHGEEEKGVLSKAKASLEIVPIPHGLAAKMTL